MEVDSVEHTLQVRGSRGFWRSWVQSCESHQQPSDCVDSGTTYANTMALLAAQGTANGGTLDGHLLFRAHTRLVAELLT